MLTLPLITKPYARINIFKMKCLPFAAQSLKPHTNGLNKLSFPIWVKIYTHFPTTDLKGWISIMPIGRIIISQKTKYNF